MTSDQLRIGDREREAAVAALGEHYAAGRLTKDEFDERSTLAYQARTSADLAPLFRDLPSAHVAPSSARATSRPHPGWYLPRLLPVVFVILGIMLLGALAHLWFVWVLLLALWWGGVLRRHHHYHHWR
ncbi:MAG: DUF1707 SHOCT-like domain-containing protein [Nocardioidaceae bacterium]